MAIIDLSCKYIIDHRHSANASCIQKNRNQRLWKYPGKSWYEIVKRRDPTFILGSLICKKCQLKLQSLENEDSESDSEDEDYNSGIST